MACPASLMVHCTSGNPANSYRKFSLPSEECFRGRRPCGIGEREIKRDVFDEESIDILSIHLPIDEVLYCIRNSKAYSFINETEDGIPEVQA